MQDQSFFNLVAGIAIALVVIVAALAFVVAPSGGVTSPTVSAGSGNPTVYRNLSISLDPATGAYSYNVAQLAVPLHVRVVFTITNFDTSSATLPSPSDANVVGTEGGTMEIVTGGGGVTVGRIPTSAVSHTFSMSDPSYSVNVPIPQAVGQASPSVVTFSEVFDFPGTFEWGCVVLCGTQDMGGTDSMYGTLTAS